MASFPEFEVARQLYRLFWIADVVAKIFELFSDEVLRSLILEEVMLVSTSLSFSTDEFYLVIITLQEMK